MTTPTKTCALGVGTRQLQRNTKKQKEQTQMQNRRSLIRAPNPNSGSSIAATHHISPAAEEAEGKKPKSKE
jgi:hypothetical protein